MTPVTDQQHVRLTLNGDEVVLAVPGEETLLATLRERVGITSARGCCGIGICGTCTVLLDGRPVSSCLLLTAMADGREVTTAEGLRAEDGALAAAQDAFVRHQAFQCSFCIPAMALTVHAVLREDPDASADEVRHELSGNLCRCGTYPQVARVVAELTGDDGAPSAPSA